MRLAVTAVMLGSLLAIGTLTVDLHGQDGRIEAWAPMPEKPNPFTPPHKALTKLSDVLAKHKGQQNWTETIVSDNLFHGDYIAMAPGAKTPRRFHQDNRAFWIVQDGQIRFTIEGISRSSRPKAISCRCRSAWSTAWRPSATRRRCDSK